MSMYEDAITVFGEENQIEVAIEEFAELIVELAKRNRLTNGTSVEKIKYEMADAELMLKQLKVIYGDNEEQIEYKKNQFRQRLQEGKAAMKIKIEQDYQKAINKFQGDKPHE